MSAHALGAIGATALRRLGSPTALDAAHSMLSAERGDPSLTGDARH